MARPASPKPRAKPRASKPQIAKPRIAAAEILPATVPVTVPGPVIPPSPTPAQRGWLSRGLDQAGGKLPLFDLNGQRVNPRTIRSCIEQGWAEPWFANPLKPDWLVCKLTPQGRALFGEAP